MSLPPAQHFPSYTKPPLDLTQQVALLESRGLIVGDHAKAEALLGQLNYYRFSGYAHPLRVRTAAGEVLENYIPGTTWKQIVDLMKFDARLRKLLFDALSYIEVAFRAALCYEAAISTGDAFWYRKPQNFLNKDYFATFERTCTNELHKNRGELFIRHYLEKYGLDSPPAWATVEILSWGCWSKGYANLAAKDVKKAVATRLGCHNSHYCESWIAALSGLRNKCAHHSRIWNKVFQALPKLSPAMTAENLPNNKVGVLILIAIQILAAIGHADKLVPQLEELNADYPEIDYFAMGMTKPELVLSL